MKYEITIGGTTRLVDVEKVGGKYRVAWAGELHHVDVLRPSPEAFHMLIDGESWEAGCVPAPEGYLVDVMGASFDVGVVDPRRRALRLGVGTAGGSMNTQMPGRIVWLLVAVGDVVTKGQPVLVIEAMKMENELKSPTNGAVAELFIVEGQVVQAGTKLLRIE